jgi:hypothetical protein
MEIKIVIQQTEDGSKVVFPLEYNEFAPEYKKFQIFLKDEAHKADFANAYSIQINHEFKVYSLISSEIKDYLSRSGSFFAIRVVIPNHKSIDEIHSLLNNIKERYMEHYQNKTMASLSFDDLTDVVEDNNFGNNTTTSVAYGIDKEAFVLWDKSSSLNTYFIQNAVKLVKCLYIFDKEKTEPIVYERMLSFDEVKQQYRKIEITSNGLLEYLKVNDIEIKKPNSNTFELITTTEAKVTYKRKDKKEFKTLNGLQNNLILQQEYQAPRPPKDPSAPDSPKGLIIAFSLLSVLILGILGWLYWDSMKPEENENSTTIENVPQIINDKTDKNLVEFKIIKTESNNEKRYKISKPDSLSSYEFVYNNGWSFINKNGKNKPVDFSKKNIKEIFENKKIKFNDTINNNFIAELEKISGQKIPEETKPKVAETIKTIKTTEKTQAVSNNKSNSNPNSTSNPKYEDNDKPNKDK